MIPIKRGTAQRLGLRRPFDVPAFVVKITGQDLTEEQAWLLKQTYHEVIPQSFGFSRTPIKRPWWKRWLG